MKETIHIITDLLIVVLLCILVWTNYSNKNRDILIDVIEVTKLSNRLEELHKRDQEEVDGLKSKLDSLNSISNEKIIEIREIIHEVNRIEVIEDEDELLNELRKVLK